jgi:hypothetical protein
MGDAPYSPLEEVRFRQVLRALDQHDLSFVIHIGDIFWRPCSDTHYNQALGWLMGVRHPLIYTPGDNEWADCWEPMSGRFKPRERLDRIRQIFYEHPDRSLGSERIPLVSQGAGGPYTAFVENARWSLQGITFATANLVGTQNAMEPFPRRTAEDDAAARLRTEAAAAWLREAFAAARDTHATAVVLACHAWMALEEPVDDPYRLSFEPYLTALEEEVERFGGPVLLVHGDFHEFIVDQPLVRRTTGRRLENFTRMQVPGSPRVGWVRVVATPGPRPTFTFQELTVPRWKYW